MEIGLIPQIRESWWLYPASRRLHNIPRMPTSAVLAKAPGHVIEAHEAALQRECLIPVVLISLPLCEALTTTEKPVNIKRN